uniref:Uncharacterized protein n=1 Tax=viral metagenome TaxID=1070528 RepID=A0A6C0I3A1_9ZZZZ
MPNSNQGALASLIISIIIFIIVLILIIAVSYNWRVSTTNNTNQPMVTNPQFLAAAMYNKNNFASPPIGMGLYASASGGSGKNTSGGSGKNKSGGSGMSAAAIAQLEANGLNIANGCGDTAVVGVGGICKPIKSFYGAKDGFQNYIPPSGSNYSAVMGQLGTGAINSANNSIPNGSITYLNGFQNYTPPSGGKY